MKKLAGVSKKGITVIKNKVGDKLVDKVDKQERGKSISRSCTIADIAANVEESKTAPNTKISFCPGVLELNTNIQKLRGIKALGPDGLPNELLRIAGCAHASTPPMHMFAVCGPSRIQRRTVARDLEEER